MKNLCVVFTVTVLFLFVAADTNFIKNFKMSVTQNQLQKLIQFMDEHPSLANGYKPNSVQGKEDINKLWRDLSEILNSNGPPMKNVAGWRKVWTDYKYRAKKKISQNLLSIQKTGGGPFEEVKITEDEEKVIQLTSMRKAVSGLKCPSFGAPSTAATTSSSAAATSLAASPSNLKNKSEDVLESILREIVESPQHSPENEIYESIRSISRKRNSTPFMAASTPKHKKENDTAKLLQIQMENDSNFQERLLNILTERNQQDAMFQARIIELLEKRNEIAEKQLSKGYF